MGISALAGAGILGAEALLAPGPPDPAALIPDPLPPGVYVVAEPVGDAPWAGVLCTSWHHVAGAPPGRCPRCSPGQA